MSVKTGVNPSLLLTSPPRCASPCSKALFAIPAGLGLRLPLGTATLLDGTSQRRDSAFGPAVSLGACRASSRQSRRCIQALARRQTFCWCLRRTPSPEMRSASRPSFRLSCPVQIQDSVPSGRPDTSSRRSGSSFLAALARQIRSGLRTHQTRVHPGWYDLSPSYTNWMAESRWPTIQSCSPEIAS